MCLSVLILLSSLALRGKIVLLEPNPALLFVEILMVSLITALCVWTLIDEVRELRRQHRVRVANS